MKEHLITIKCERGENFMDYVDEIFARSDLQQIREFLLHGTECIKISPFSYKERIEHTLKKLMVRLHEEYPNEQEYEEITALVFDYASALEEVNMEIGLQVGAALCGQMYQNFKNALAGE